MEKDVFYISAQEFFVTHSCSGGLNLFAVVSGRNYYICNCLTHSQAKQMTKIWMGV